jgi:hypothetical protein
MIRMPIAIVSVIILNLGRNLQVKSYLVVESISEREIMRKLGSKRFHRESLFRERRRSVSEGGKAWMPDESKREQRS